METLTDVELKALYDIAKNASERELGAYGDRTGTRIIRLIDELLFLRAERDRGPAKAMLEQHDARVTELLTHNTELVGLNRVLSAKVNALETILKFALIESPMAIDLATKLGAGPGTAIRTNHGMHTLYERIRILEEHATTRCVSIASNFIADMRRIFGDAAVDTVDDNDAWASVPEEVKESTDFWLVRRWVIEFRRALK